MEQSANRTETLASRLATLRDALVAEHEQREKVRSSKKFIAAMKKLQEASAEMDAMIEGIPDSQEEYAECEKQLSKLMAESGADRVGNIIAHYRQRRAVNGGRLFSVLGSDIGLFMEIATVSQKSLNEFAKGNPDLKKELTGCIEDVGREIDSLSFLDS